MKTDLGGVLAEIVYSSQYTKCRCAIISSLGNDVLWHTSFLIETPLDNSISWNLREMLDEVLLEHVHNMEYLGKNVSDEVYREPSRKAIRGVAEIPGDIDKMVSLYLDSEIKESVTWPVRHSLNNATLEDST